jgi:aryl-alcohol dehydrogenase-like predicted oxidoreductase
MSQADRSVATVELAPGYRISRLIRGGWQLAGDHGLVERERAIEDMLAFPEAGITTFDCADIYRGVEEMIGELRTRYAARHGSEALRRLRVHTKYVPDADSLPPTRAQMRAAIERSLARLRQERLDLVQLHWWRYEVPGAVETALWLKQLQAEGKIDRVGATNFDTPHLAELVAAGVPLVAFQTQYSLLDRRPENGMTALLARHGMTLLAYGTLAGGFLTDAWLGRPDPGRDFANRSLVKYRLIIDELGGWGLFQELLAACRRIADRHGVTIANVATRWVLDRPTVGAVIIGARYASHLPENLRTFAFSLTDLDRAEIDTVLGRATGPRGDTYALERDRGGPHGRIMKYNLNAGEDELG